MPIEQGGVSEPIKKAPATEPVVKPTFNAAAAVASGAAAVGKVVATQTAQAGGASSAGAADVGGDTGGGDNSGGAPPAPAAPNIDWADAFWGSLGLPPDLVSQINSALAGYTDSTIADAVGENILTQSSWFQQNFPGYNTGLTAGLYSDVNGYRSYIGQLNQMTQAFLGRPVTVADTIGYLNQGLSTSQVGNILQGNAYAAANAGELNQEFGAFGQGGEGPNGTLSTQQLQAYGQNQSGYDTALGEKMKTAVDKAQKLMSTIFTGKLAVPSGTTLGAQGLNSPGLLGAKTPTSGLSNQVPA